MKSKAFFFVAVALLLGGFPLFAEDGGKKSDAALVRCKSGKSDIDFVSCGAVGGSNDTLVSCGAVGKRDGALVSGASVGKSDAALLSGASVCERDGALVSCGAVCKSDGALVSDATEESDVSLPSCAAICGSDVALVSGATVGKSDAALLSSAAVCKRDDVLLTGAAGGSDGALVSDEVCKSDMSLPTGVAWINDTSLPTGISCKSNIALLSSAPLTVASLSKDSDTESPFAMNLGWDIAIASTAAASYATAFILKHTLTFPEQEDFSYDRSAIPAIDAWAVNPFSKPLDFAGNISVATCLASPAAVFLGLAAGKEMEWKDALTVGVMYAEAALLTLGIKDLLKVGVKRLRPYTYYDPSTWEVDPSTDNDYMFSHPSGHTAEAFLGAGFLTYVFSSYYPSSPWKYLVAGASYSLAAATGALRIMSGNHFFTDVMAGALIGTITGYGVPMLHQLIAANSHQSKAGEQPGLEVSPLGLGLNVRLKL